MISGFCYADIIYYRNNFMGKFDGTDEDLLRLLNIASRKIDSVTFNRVVGIGFENLTDYQRERLRQACCFQADFMAENGFDGGNVEVSGYSVADIRVSLNNNAVSKAQRGRFSQIAYELLELSGLMCRGV